MNRLQKKCFIASAGLHSLLVLILLVGPAFLSSKGRPDDMQVLDVIPSKLVDAAFSGGKPKAAPPPPAPPAPPQPVAKPAPQPEKQREPDPPKPKVDPESLEASKESKPKKHDIVLTPIKRPPTTKSTPAKDSSSDAQDRKLAEKRRSQITEAIGSTARTLRSDLSTTTTIDSDSGPGGGGPAYANYALAVKSIYEHAWMPPDDSKSDDAVTKVTVTIRKDGTVASSRVIRASGDTSVDRSVQRTLDRVTFVAPFPDGAKESERTYTINFNLKAKRLLG